METVQTNMFRQSTGRTKKQGHVLQNKDCGAVFCTGISHEEGEFIVDPGASSHMMSKRDLIREKKQFGTRKNLV